MQHLLAERSRRSHHLHSVHVHPRFRHTAHPHTDLLLPGDKETADRRPEEQIEGKETVSPQGDETGVDGDYRVCIVLAALLADASRVDLYSAEAVSEQDHHHQLSARRFPQLQQQRDEPDPLRVPQRQLQEELPKSVHLRCWKRRERHVAHREQRVPAKEQGERREATVESIGRVRPVEVGAGGRGRGERTADQQNFHDHRDHDVTIEHYHRQRSERSSTEGERRDEEWNAVDAVDAGVRDTYALKEERR